jgi:acyl-CoA reductase-like NAD-dependent aldehyde dehydrogenase
MIMSAQLSTPTDESERGIFLQGKFVKTGITYSIQSPYNGDFVATVHRAGPAEVERAIAGATQSFQVTRKLPTWKRSEVLERISAGLLSHRESLAQDMAREAGKPISAARAEVDRAAFTFKVAAEEARRIYGEIIPFDWLPGTEGRTGYVQRVPLGPIVGITPFNYPLNLVAHKVAPALAAGNPIIIRPASQTPLSALNLGRIVVESGWPEDAIAVLPSSVSDAAPLIEDDRIKLLTFTGSPEVGWNIKARSKRKRVTLELGGNAGVIVHHDADLAYAAERVAWGGFQYAGQSCISVQRVYIQEDVYDAFTDLLRARVGALKLGDPLDETTDIGPVIDLANAERIESWIKSAVAQNARVLVGGKRQGTLVEPTVLADISEDMPISCQEVFGPVLGLYRYKEGRDAIHAVTNSDFGLQAGIFTNDWRLIQDAFEEIEVGGLVVNDVSTFRIDHQPYGGVKSSGAGREGVRYAIEEMTEIKVMSVNRR